jgi:hypothetical protein
MLTLSGVVHETTASGGANLTQVKYHRSAGLLKQKIFSKAAIIFKGALVKIVVY